MKMILSNSLKVLGNVIFDIVLFGSAIYVYNTRKVAPFPYLNEIIGAFLLFGVLYYFLMWAENNKK